MAMNTLLRILVTLPGILFVVIGLGWLVVPAQVANEFGMPLLDGIGRSNQIGDLSVVFLALGIMILVAVITSERRWFHVPALMLLGVGCARILAWLVHDAAFAGQSIAIEFGVGCLLLVAAARLAVRE